MSLPDHLVSIRDEALRTSCDSWAIRKKWKLSKGRDRSGPCPKCGGDDRFSINTVKNVFNCRADCGVRGEGVIALVMTTQDVGFTEACEIITGRSAEAPPDPERDRLNAEANEKAEREKAEVAERYRQQARRDAHGVWMSGRQPQERGQVLTYLTVCRGLDLMAHPAIGGLNGLRMIREIDRLPFLEEGEGPDGRKVWNTLHNGPAMLLPIILPARLCQAGDPLGQFGGVHRTWIDLTRPKGRLVLPLTASGKDRPTKKMLGAKQGGAIPLYTPKTPRRIVMGEGAETTLTPFCLAFEPDTAYWAGGDVGNMAGKAARDASGKWLHDQPDMDDLGCFIAPEWCEELVFLGEADEPGKHQREKCIRGLRRSLRLRPGLKITYVPPVGGQPMDAD